MHTSLSTILTFVSKFVRAVHRICRAHKPLCLTASLAARHSSTTASPASISASGESKRESCAPAAVVLRGLPSDYFVLYEDLRSFLPFGSHVILATHARAQINTLVLVNPIM